MPDVHGSRRSLRDRLAPARRRVALADLSIHTVGWVADELAAAAAVPAILLARDG